ncbi:B12-binding domain/radical SAM domain protein, MJ_1487 family [Candidatus Methanoperedens nitroreducens]|uniref:B12-binding domain/radical SAM domain protein, MJ_1487 family n=1 Tax=Candidatus Methanoperedens nitratireducens TaxID=1392998 RepID=A0A062V6T9_9EURY|nr:TIGR04013 family B12-binding domain/radical SAM domain-containing protein [Candidatus Methanoperedens nitroreducens]KCZ71469.1 B12-binding domain/radical SAM domain protein, MJ_1487 family [Candidatus Methanoperedens nitroreducens]MDJ1421098.1 TIGR04013 family B12-binding domain/radical SAM domain-containing protein [Candidatus Methanoperedens sp.]
MPISNINFRYFKHNMQSIAALMPLLPESNLVRRPCDGIMIYSFATTQAASIFREVEQSKTNSIFIAGGPHPSARPDETLEFFDYVVTGEGEETLPELIDVLQKGGEPSSIRGIAFKKEGSIIFTGKRDNIDLDRYPPFDPRMMHSSIEISRGCPFNCSYCQTPQLFGHRMRHRSIDVIARHAEFLRDIRFTSPNAFAYGSDGIHPRIEKIEALLSALPGRSIFFGTFPSEVRPEFINERLLELVSDHCANRTLSMGGQSGSQRILDSINRNHTVEDIIIGAERCLQHGFIPVVDFIFGLPYETEEDQLDTLRLIKWLTGKGAKVHSHYFMPLPGTALENTLPSPLSREVDRMMGELALHGKATGVWSKA